MLDTKFPRILGDVGNRASFDFPVRYGMVLGATPEAIVQEDARHWAEAFIAAGQTLVAEGCTGLATTCGFLSLMREKLAAACDVPVAASALEQAALVASLLPPSQKPGILTISADSLTTDHLRAANVPAKTPVHGMDGSSFARSILTNAQTLDVDAARAEITSAARSLCDENLNIGAIILECTNMPPYAVDVAAATGRPVYDARGYFKWFAATLPPSHRA